MTPMIKKLNLLLILIVFYSLYFLQNKLHANNPSFKVSPYAVPVIKMNENDKDIPYFNSDFASHLNNKSVHCAAAIELPENKIRAFWYGGTKEGAEDVQIYSAVYDSKTASWSDEIPVITREYTQKYLYRSIKKLGNMTTIRDKSGMIWLFYVSVSCGGWSGSSINYVKSSDEGESWSEPNRLITSPFFNVSTLVKNPPFLYEDGTIGIPVYHEFIGKFSELLRIDTSGHIILKKRLSSGRELISPFFIPLTLTEAKCYFRYCGLDKSQRFIHMSESHDSGETWSELEELSLINHNSSFCIIKLTDKLFLKVLNNTNDRNIISLAVSNDRGENWKTIHVLESVDLDPRVEYEFSYPWILCSTDKKIHVLYTWNRMQIKHVIFNYNWIKSRL